MLLTFLLGTYTFPSNQRMAVIMSSFIILRACCSLLVPHCYSVCYFLVPLFQSWVFQSKNFEFGSVQSHVTLGLRCQVEPTYLVVVVVVVVVVIVSAIECLLASSLVGICFELFLFNSMFCLCFAEYYLLTLLLSIIISKESELAFYMS